MDPGPKPSPKVPGVALWAVLICLALLLVLFGSEVRSLLQRILEQVQALGAWGPVLFVLLYIVSSILLVPASILTLGAGALFGLVQGTLLVWTAATLAATCAFLIGRYLAREWVAEKIAGHPKFVAIDNAVGREGWKMVLLTRLSPAFPFVLLNYAFGLTRVSFWSYVVATAGGMLPASIAYVYVGTIARAGAATRQRSTGEWALYGVGLAATVAVTVLITRIATRALSSRTAQKAFDGEKQGPSPPPGT